MQTRKVVPMIIIREAYQLHTEQLNALIGQIKALVYVRVSTDDQAKYGYSLESQIERCVRYAESKHHYSREQLMILVEAGEHGDNPDRPLINYLLYLLERGIGSKAIFLHPDRMSRYLHLQIELSSKIWDLGCDIEFVEFDLDKNNPESMLMFNVQGSIAQYNKAKILANTKRGRRTKALKGEAVGMRRLYGYSFDTEEDRIVENPEERRIYMMMVDMVLNKGYSCSRIARELSSRGIAAPNGSVWYQATVSRILKNESYTGTYYYGKTEVVQQQGKQRAVRKSREEWIAIPIPAYIERATYEQIQHRLKSWRKTGGRPSEDYLLRGLARCGRCGAAVTSGVTTKTAGGRVKYYTCTGKTKKGYKVGAADPARPVCRGRNWRVDRVDAIVWQRLSVLLAKPEPYVIKYIEGLSSHHKLQELQLRKAELQRMITDRAGARSKYVDLYAYGIIRTKEELQTKLESLDEQLNILRKDMQFIDEMLQQACENFNYADRVIKYVRQLKDLLSSSSLSMADKRAFIGLLIDQAVLHEDGRIELIMAMSECTYQNLIHSQSDGRL